MSRQTKLKLKFLERKWGAFIALGLLVLLGLVFLLPGFFGKKSQELGTDGLPMQLGQVSQGSVASSSLLTGTVKAVNEEKIYYDSSRGGAITAVYVTEGQHVYQGQPLMQYATTVPQANYDQAVRALNKVARQINDLQATGVVTSSATGEAVDWASAQRTYDSQMSDLNDTYLDAQQAVARANEALVSTLEVSAVTGRVVQVNTAIDPSKAGGQLVMHVVSDDQLVVEGSLTEFDLANVRLNQQVTLTSKVYPDKTWSGRVTYVSNYPGEATASTGTGGSTSGASYPFKVTIDGDTSDLRQGFKMSMTLESSDKSLLVPLGAIQPEGETSYVWLYDKESQKISRQVVTLGKADALNQEVTQGLKAGDSVIVNPSPDLSEGQTLAEKDLLPAVEGVQP